MHLLQADLQLHNLRGRLRINADKDNPGLVLSISNDKGSAPLSEMNASSCLLQNSIAHLHGDNYVKMEEAVLYKGLYMGVQFTLQY